MSISSIAHTMTSELWPILFSKADSQRPRPSCKGLKNVLLLWSIFNKHSACFFWWGEYRENWLLYNYNSYIFKESYSYKKHLSRTWMNQDSLRSTSHWCSSSGWSTSTWLISRSRFKISNQLTSYHLCMSHQIFVLCFAEWCDISNWIGVDHCSGTV